MKSSLGGRGFQGSCRRRPTPVVVGALSCVFGLAAGVATPARATTQGLGITECNQTPAPVVSPTILGETTLSAIQVSAWWDSTARGQPAALSAPIADVISLYVAEGAAEGVRSDLAFAQAVHTTGYFTSTNTSISNFGAGIDRPFPDVPTGVRAHVQLLKKFAAGNSTQLANPDEAPRASARSTTWAALAGTWASSANYWSSLADLYNTMLSHAGLASLSTPTEPAECPTAPSAAPDSNGALALTTVAGITVHTSIAAEVDTMIAAARADGLVLDGWGYRSHDQQIALRRSHCGTSQYAIWEMPAGQCSPPTARPGTSMHEKGLAIDFANCSSRSTRCYQWLAANAATAVEDFALHNLASEPWHWSTDGT